MAMIALLHQRGIDHARQDPTVDAYVPCAGPLLVTNVALMGLLGARDTPVMRCPLGLFGQYALRATGNSILLLEGFFHLIHGANVCAERLHMNIDRSTHLTQTSVLQTPSLPAPGVTSASSAGRD